MLGTITITVGQRSSEDVREKDPEKEMATNSEVTDTTKDGQEEIPEIIEEIPSSASNLDEIAHSTESQANDVGFKKVFKFVGFKFTVKKDKTEKSDTVQLVTVQKEEGEGAEGSNGAGDHQEASVETEGSSSKESELKQSTEELKHPSKHEQSITEISTRAESDQAAEESSREAETQEREPPRPLDSPTSPINETASPFKKFFTQGWAGWRKKSSFRKPKDDELEASEKPREQEPEKPDMEGEENTEGVQEQPAASPQPPAARLSAEYEKVELPELPSEPPGPAHDKPAPLASEVFDETIEGHREVAADVHACTAEAQDPGTPWARETPEEATATAGEATATAGTATATAGEATAAAGEATATAGEATATAGEAEPTLGAPEGDRPSPADLAPDEPSKHPEGAAGEAELLSSQERIKAQGSPLKKLFSSSGLKKLSGKKPKGKRGGDEESGEHRPAPAESPDSADEQKAGDSSASSPEEPEEPAALEKALGDGPREGEVEEGATSSDGEKKREGITPWASFKKMVTPKKRVRRPSESDKEDELDKLDKVKSATLSSTESAASEAPDDAKGAAEEPRPEEPRRKVDSSVSWEALICVGSSKKRARKASSSSEEGDAPPAEEASREPGADAGPEPQEPGQQGSSSPEPAGSPSEGEGVSTWESFKRLVTPRKKSKSKLEEKTDDGGVETSASASDLEPGREESWASIKKFIPGRRKKRSDGKREAGPAEEAAGPAEATEDDGDVPAVVPLAEYDAVEREKMEAQLAQGGQGAESRPGAEPDAPSAPAQQCGPQVDLYVSEEVSQSLVHTVTVAVIDGARAVADLEERSPSWISASVTQPPEPAEEDEARPPSGEAMGASVEAGEAPAAPRPGDDPVPSDVDFTSAEAVTAAEPPEALCAEEATEPSGAEETTEMVSAVSQLTDSPRTAEEATPVREAEGAAADAGEQERRTRAVLQAVAEKVRGEAEPADTRGPHDGVQTAPQEPPTPAMGGPEQGALEETVQDTEADLGAARSGEAEEAVSEAPAEASAEAQPQETMGAPAIPPDSAETLTDSETDGSTPVAEFEAGDSVQQDEVLGTPGDTALASRTQSQAAEEEPSPAQQEAPPAPSSCQTQEEKKEPAEAETVLECTQGELLGEAGPVVLKTEVCQEVGQMPDEEAKEDGPWGEGHEVSTRTDGAESPEKAPEVAPDGEAAAEAGCQMDDALELQQPSLQEREVEAQAGREDPTEAQPLQESEQEPAPKAAALRREEVVSTVDTPQTSSPDRSPSPPRQAHEVEVEGCGASAPLTAGAVEEVVEVVEEVLEETKISEAGETLQSAGAPVVPAEKSVEREEDQAPQLEGDDVSAEPETQAMSIPVLLTSHEKGLEREGSGPQTGQAADGGDEQVSWQEDHASTSSEGDLKAELESESSKIIQNVIQTAVDQFIQKEETAVDMITSDSQTQALSLRAEEAAEEQAPVQDETQTLAAHEESEPTTVGPALSKDVSEMSEKILTIGMESSGVGGQQLDEVVPPSEADGDGSRAKAVSDEGLHELRERIEKPPSEPKENKKGDAHLEAQISAPADAEVSGGLTKESSDTNGPKVTEEEPAQEPGFQEGKGHGESDKEIRSPKEEEMQKPEREPAKSELTEC
ncbi:A-kinase anchor protein 12 isoform X2 [Dipodomys spectabilis]|uniref:A-kinase anchor protein 12 isoform X2 n=1 Tax=Dipodomys spectabilis TaxID=105255 RepID=UPI001C535774|nr:A-kinase anchor protein 12 isoform X2 [Dipodomys spectabilis]